MNTKDPPLYPLGKNAHPKPICQFGKSPQRFRRPLKCTQRLYLKAISHGT